MPIIGLSVLLQVLCAVHIIRNYRNRMWLWAVVMLSIPGCIAYFVFEILPDLWGSREAQIARTKATKLLDPERELRAAYEALSIAKTPANYLRVGDALTELRRHIAAAEHYEAALTSVNAADPLITYKLASALFETGQANRALSLLDALPPPGSPEGDRVALLRARVLETLGRYDEAMALLADLVTRYPGDEARCRYAHLLIRAGRSREAEAMLAEVMTRAKRLSASQRASMRDMYDWAEAELRRLRVDSAAF